MRGRTCQRWIAALLVTAGWLGLAQAAAAGTFSVYSCAAPAGGVAPIGDDSYGWRATPRAAPGDTSLTDECAGRGGIHGRLAGARPQARGAGGAWTYVPPPDTAIRGFDITWDGAAANGGEATISRSDQPDPTYVRRYGGDFAPETVSERNLEIASVGVIVACSFQDPCPAGPDVSDYRMSRTRMLIGEDSAPRPGPTSGLFTTSPTLQGRVAVSVGGEDSGGGLYRLIVRIDGQERQAIPLADPGSRCLDADPPRNGPYEFVVPRPCPNSLRRSLEIDADQLPEGRHSVQLELEDAAGNRARVYGPVDKQIVRPAGRGALNGTNGGDGATFADRSRRIRVTSFAGRRVVVSGRLTNGGAPVAGALLDLLQQNRVPRAPLRRIGEVRTDAEGRFRLKVPSGPSRLLRIGYRAFANDAAPAARADTVHRVRAPVALGAVRRRVGLRGTVRLRGRLRGGFIPRRGKLVQIQAFDRGAWREVRTVRARRSGRFSAAYRFTRTRRPTSFRFRARVRYEIGYPFVLGTSRPLRVRVG